MLTWGEGMPVVDVPGPAHAGVVDGRDVFRSRRMVIAIGLLVSLVARVLGRR